MYILALKLVVSRNVLMAGLLLIGSVAVIGKLYGGIVEDSHCFKSHTPTTQKPTELKTAEDYLVLGDYDYESGNCTQAIKDLDMSLKLNPKFAEAYNNRGFVLKKLKRYTDSIRDFDKAIQIRPDYPHALMNRGDAYKALGNKEKALEDFDRVIDLGILAVKSEAVCGRRDMLIYNENFIRSMWNALTKNDECWKMYFN